MFRWSALGDPFCKIYTTLVVIALSSSIYHFVFVNFERLMALKFPIDYRSPNSRRKIKIGIACCWLLSLLPALPMWIIKPSTNSTTSTTSTNSTTTTSTFNTTQSCHFPYDDVNLRRPGPPYIVIVMMLFSRPG